MKRIIAVIMLIVCTFSFTACTKKSISNLNNSASVKDPGTKDSANSSESENDRDATAASGTKTESETGKSDTEDTVKDTASDSDIGFDDIDIELSENPDLDDEIESVEHLTVTEGADGILEIGTPDSSEDADADDYTAADGYTDADEDEEVPLFYFGTYGLQVYVYSHDALEVMPGEVTLRGVVGYVEDPETILPYAAGDVIDIRFDSLTELHNPEMLDHYEPGFDAVDWLNNLAGDEYGVGVAGVYDVLIHNCRVEDVFGLYWWD